VKTFIGWLTALTKGTAGWPHTWEFFRNTLLSGGLFTGLFVGAMKFTEESEPVTQEDSQEAPVDDPPPEAADNANP
jgi:Leu/Phe-tRNA-protein transferase